LPYQGNKLFLYIVCTTAVTVDSNYETHLSVIFISSK